MDCDDDGAWDRAQAHLLKRRGVVSVAHAEHDPQSIVVTVNREARWGRLESYVLGYRVVIQFTDDEVRALPSAEPQIKSILEFAKTGAKTQ